jgi:hypothetical protein
LFYPIVQILPKDLHALAAGAKVPIRMVPSQQAMNTSYLFRAIVFLVKALYGHIQKGPSHGYNTVDQTRNYTDEPEH